jgi:hypothetical protein
MRVCPRCREAELCYKTGEAGRVVYNSSMSQQEIDSNISDKKESLKAKEDYVEDVVGNIFDKIATVNPGGKVVIPRLKPKQQTCDVCGDKFESTIETSRCDKCYEELMFGVQKSIEKETKPKKKKAKKKKVKTK